MLPAGTYATNPDDASRSSVRAKIFGHLDDALAERLGAVVGRHVHRPGDARLRHVLRFDDANPFLVRERAEVRRRGLDLVVGRGLRVLDHRVGRAHPRLGALAIAVLEVGHLLNDVRGRQSRERRVLGTALAVDEMAEPARAHLRPAAVRHRLPASAGCASGCQSGGLNASRVCAIVSETVLPGTCCGAGSAAAGAGFAPGAGGGFTVYAHGGGDGACALPIAIDGRARPPRSPS